MPNFDLILLGLGEDGHTASLFPRSEALKANSQWVAANHVANLDTWRLTFTYPLINAARQILFMASGDNKAKVVKEIIEDRNPALPATDIHTENVAWYLDRTAAGLLSRQTLCN